MRKRGIAVFPVSCATGEGIQALLDVTAEALFTGRTDKLHVELPEKPVKKAAAKKAVVRKAPAKKPPARKAVVKKAVRAKGRRS
jgi:GTP-binding protein